MLTMRSSMRPLPGRWGWRQTRCAAAAPRTRRIELEMAGRQRRGGAMSTVSVSSLPSRRRQRLLSPPHARNSDEPRKACPCASKHKLSPAPFYGFPKGATSYGGFHIGRTCFGSRLHSKLNKLGTEAGVCSPAAKRQLARRSLDCAPGYDRLSAGPFMVVH